ncbi:unnamed protein product [Sphagnum jensenii]|uniref:Phospholipid-transporting ATPase n=1 Tax=Sphagnum jensenii TaxID=128206 RepID=A0ABP1ADD0_9BRYO
MTNAKPLLIPLPHSIPSPDITSPTSPVANGQSCFTRVPLDKDSLGTSSSHGFRTLSPVIAAKTLAFSHLSKPSYQSAHPSLGHDCSISSTESQSKTSFDQSAYETSELEPDDPQSRIVYINNPVRTNEKYEMAGNRVHTSKYSLLTFLPRNLFEQFHRFAYIYFLVIVILNQIPALAVFGRTASLFPLVFVLVLTAIKDGYEDWGRHRSDRVENMRTSLVLQEGHYKPKKWDCIQVGEMVKLLANESVPCDMVLLGTSDPSGVAYVETLNLDGESNLKSRYARQETADKHPESGPISGSLTCELPNRNIYEFTAYMELNGEQFPLGPNNIILRGCEVKNTSWVVGVVVYAGRETKAMLNSSGAQSKRSRLEQYMNRETGWLIVFLIVICLVGGFGMGLWVQTHLQWLPIIQFYKRTGDYMYTSVAGEAIIGFLSCIIIFQIMIPISLYISMEAVRLGQSYFMIRDMQMYHPGSDTRFQCRALNINEDLGQIKYLFSDKTGTLTENKMEFHTASIDGIDYSDASVVMLTHLYVLDELTELAGTEAWRPKVIAKVDPKLVRLLQSPLHTIGRKVAHEYMLVLAACNTIVPTRVKVSATGQLEMHAANTEEGVGSVEYQGESPDEQALVSAAAAYGYSLVERTSSSIVINVLGEIQRYEVLGIHEFDSVRKRMSVVVECPDRTIKLLVKGADTSVMDIVATVTEAPQSVKSAVHGDSLVEEKHRAEVVLRTLGHLDNYAREGLRTLVVASKTLTQREVEEWHFHYAKASTALTDRVAMLRNTAALVENNLTLLGSTGIEDKLQQGVPETIALLREAGIKVWVLTGDKQETAISIGFSCLLLTRDMQQIIINENSRVGCQEAIMNAKAMHRIMSTQKEMESGVTQRRDQQPLALIIDGNSLVHALSEELEQDLYELATACKVVVCCRVAPLQKAGIVSLVKRKSKEMTLAVGDGANDVSMIQMADVGVGISGQEGRQAVMASDFAMGRFRFLSRLLLVHGHWNYQRLGYMVLYNFYRNAVFVMMLFWFIFYTAFSPQTALTDWNLVFYSLLYTSVPTIVTGILDKDLSHRTLLNYPQLYGSGQREEAYNQTLFWATMLDTLWQSLVIFYVPYFVYNATDIDLYGLGCLWLIAVVVLVNVNLAMDILRWNWVTHVAVWGSVIATFVCQIIMDSLSFSDDLLPHYWVVYHIAGDARSWLSLLLTVIIALVPRFCVKVLVQRIWASDIQIAREAEIIGGHFDCRSERSMELNEVPLP